MLNRIARIGILSFIADINHVEISCMNDKQAELCLSEDGVVMLDYFRVAIYCVRSGCRRYCIICLK